MAAGYSGTPLARKIGVRRGDLVVLVDAPEHWQLGELPEDVRVARAEPVGATGLTVGSARVAVAFFGDLASLRAQVPGLASGLLLDASLWLAWPRRAGGHRSDITDEAIRAVVLPLGLVDVKVAALDEDWSGLKFVWRKEVRG